MFSNVPMVSDPAVLHEAPQFLLPRQQCEDALRNYSQSLGRKDAHAQNLQRGLVCGSGKPSAEACFVS